ncbi:hypothetical protein RN001_006716 [Aquatica leii]|uniref:Mutator-like transposase domain-containing protein n=1 Tax=Aquatica leii TaxID=1421715 RepID=A0AAN7SIR7_9COLE|nr:hypothetical protein RN001_006716 [Aquatica leii]
MPGRTHSRVKNRGKASRSKRIRDKRERSLRMYRIVNFEYFTSEFSKVVLHDIHCTMGKMIYKKENKIGIVSSFFYHCQTCDKTLKKFSHPPETTKNVNKMIVWGANSIGIGYVQTEELLSTAVRSAIINNSKTIKDVEQLREDLRNSPYHVFGDHSKCPLEYCKRKNEDEINYVTLLKQIKMFSEVWSALDYLVCKANRLVTNATTNYAERYMSLVSKFSGGKRINFCKRGSYLRRCIGAGLSFNNGSSWHKHVVKTKKVHLL